MAGVIVPQARQKDDALTTVMKGLAIAKDIYGIRVASQQLEDHNQAKQDEQQGVLSKSKLLEMSKTHEQVPEGTPGALAAYVRDEGGKKSPIYLAAKGQAPKLAQVKVRNKDGSETIQFVPESEGTKLTSFPQKDTGKLQLITTTDASGNQVQRFVSPQEGATYGKAEEKPNDAQTQAAGFGKRALASSAIVEGLMQEGYDPSSASKLKNKVPVLGNFMASSDDQSFDQAKRDFISAVLRKESGAAISDTEYANEDKKYFPQPGDNPQVMAQKAEARQRAIATLQAQAGKSWEKVGDVATGKRTGASGNWGEAVAAPQSKVDSKVADYAKKNGLDYTAARNVLTARGYKPND